MIRFRLFGIGFSMPWLTLAAPVLACRLGMKANILPIVLALLIHEAAHFISARCMGIKIEEICILPFGGSARMENPYRLAPFKLLIVSAAGPLSSLMAAIACAALVRYGIIPFYTGAAHVRINLTLFLFNLLPALPLDGGRMLYAVLQKPIGQVNALRTGIVSGIVLSLCFLWAAIRGMMMYKKLNISLVFAAIFILSSAQDEQEALLEARMNSIIAGIEKPVTLT